MGTEYQIDQNIKSPDRYFSFFLSIIPAQVLYVYKIIFSECQKLLELFERLQLGMLQLLFHSLFIENLQMKTLGAFWGRIPPIVN